MVRNTFVEVFSDHGGTRRRCLSASRLALVALKSEKEDSRNVLSDSDVTCTCTPADSTPRSSVPPASPVQFAAHLADALFDDMHDSPRTWAPVDSPWASDDEFEDDLEGLPLCPARSFDFVPIVVQQIPVGHCPQFLTVWQPAEPDPESHGYDEEDWLSAGVVTVMLRNIPNKYSLQLLLAEFETMGFGGFVDFVYMPIDTNFRVNRGYAFVNFRDAKAAVQFRMQLQGRSMRRFRSSKVVRVDRAMVQGFQPNLAKVRSQQEKYVAMGALWFSL